jgi:UDP-glucose 4-epimerase
MRETTQRIVVTGAAGRIGRPVAAALAAEGNEVLGLDARAAQSPPGVVHDTTALHDDNELPARLAGADAVVHLAAFMSWDVRDAAALYRSNVTATFQLLEACVVARVRRFLFASSGDVYPESAPAYCPIDEAHPRQPTSRYGMTKLLGEELVAHYSRAEKLATTVIRLEHTQEATELLDPGSFFSGPRFFLKPRILRERGLGNHELADILEAHDSPHGKLLLLRDSKQRASVMPITDTRDAVQGILLALRKEGAVGKTIGIGAAEPVHFEAALSRMSALTGLDVAEITVPGSVPRYTVSIERARRLLGYEPEWSFDAMLGEAAGAQSQRSAKRTGRS